MPRMYFRTFINPLKLMEWEPEFRASNLPDDPAPEGLVEFLCPLDMSAEMSAFKERYKEVSKCDRNLVLTPEESELKENVFGPLRQAKTNYAIGNYLGSIALCGIVAEMVALFVYNINILDVAKRQDFEDMYHADRLKLLKSLDLIGEKSRMDFGEIGVARKSALHFWNTPEEGIAKRAARAYASATRLVLDVMDVEFIEGNVRLNPKLRKYLEDRGDIVIKDDSD